MGVSSIILYIVGESFWIRLSSELVYIDADFICDWYGFWSGFAVGIGSGKMLVLGLRLVLGSVL